MHNPYAAPQAVVEDLPATDIGPLEAQRRALIRHEVQLKSVGSLYYFGGVISLLSTVTIISSGVDQLALGGLVVILLVLSLVYLVLGYGFRRVRSWVRIPGAIVAVLGLLSFPVGTLISAWILYLMFGEKGRQVLAPEYQQVIAATPQVRFQRSIGDWIALIVILLLLFGFVALMLIGLGSYR